MINFTYRTLTEQELRYFFKKKLKKNDNFTVSKCMMFKKLKYF